jgi:HAD superfamily hydrolase (TIGR01549 family)
MSSPKKEARTLFLDAGGVLMNPNWRRVSQALQEEGVTAPAASLAGAEHFAKYRMDVPERVRITTDESRGSELFDLVLKYAGVRPSPASDRAFSRLREYHARYNLWEHVPAEVAPGLERLRRIGLRLVVVSNANGTLVDHMRRLGLDVYFEHMLDSHDEGVEKPDPRLFWIALERSGAKAEHTIHVGDLYNVDVVGARTAGLRAVLFDAAGLYTDVDCPRVASLAALADALVAGEL